jgi:Zn-dependent protease with chaperone function
MMLDGARRRSPWAVPLAWVSLAAAWVAFAPLEVTIVAAFAFAWMAMLSATRRELPLSPSERSSPRLLVSEFPSLAEVVDDVAAPVEVYVSHAEPLEAVASPAGVVIGDELARSPHLAAALAHEAEHVRAGHLRRSAMLSMLPSAVLVAGVAARVFDVVGAVTAGVLVAAAMFAAFAFEAFRARRDEFDADAAAVRAVGSDALIDALQALVSPAPATLFSRHPSLSDRIAAARALGSLAASGR